MIVFADLEFSPGSPGTILVELYYIVCLGLNPVPAGRAGLLYPSGPSLVYHCVTRLRRSTMMDQFGRMIVLVGIILVVVGLVMTFLDRIPFLGKLPGDIHIKRGNFQLYIPVVTSIVLSVLISLLLTVASRFWRK
jgi:hypothetical protein